MCESMVDIKSATTEIREEKRTKKKPQDENIMACPIPLGGHNKVVNYSSYQLLENNSYTVNA